MRVAAIGSASHAASAMARGLRAQLDAAALEQALAGAGLLDPALHESLAAVQRVARSTTEAGARLMALEPLGRLLDVVA